MTKGKFRLFFAIELSPAVQTQLLEFQSSIELEQAKPVPAENFHITLSFLGDTNEKQLESIMDNFIAPEIPAFTLTSHELVYWPKPKVACLSVVDPENQLENCKKQVEKQLNALGFHHYDKKPYSPHITLFRQVEIPPKENHPFNAKLKIDHISLLCSRQSKNGVYYELVEDWPLVRSVKHQLTGKF